jgi:NTE family protein
LYFGVGMAEQGQSDNSDAVYLSFGKNY